MKFGRIEVLFIIIIIFGFIVMLSGVTRVAFAQQDIRQNYPRIEQNTVVTPEEVLEKYDTDKDGALSKEEMQVWKEDLTLRLYDTNGDGEISGDEQVKMEIMQALKETYDENEDGELSYTERMKMMGDLMRVFGPIGGDMNQGNPRNRGPRRNN